MSDPCDECIDQPIADHGENPELIDEGDER
jgi:hypothetical protein